MKYKLILAEISRQLWAITPGAMDGILAALDGGLLPTDRELFHAANIEAVISHVGEQYSEQLATARISNGVGIITIDGPIVPRGGIEFDTSGLVSIDRLTAELKAFEADPEVKEILLLIDSPGGSVTGVDEFASLVAKSEKITSAYVYGFAASAAYWIASAADRITISETGLVGSIGTVLTVRRKSENEPIQIVSSQSPNKRPDPETDDGKRELLRLVDGLAGVFVNAVARNRKVDTKTVLSDFGQGGLVLAADALKAGMVDAVATLDNYLALAMSGAGSSDVVTAAADSRNIQNHIDNKPKKIEKQDNNTTNCAVKSTGVNQMPKTLKALLEENPEAKAEHEALLDHARATVASETARDEDVEFASRFVGTDYPEKIRAFALDVIKGKLDRKILDAAVSVYDSLKASEEIEQAQAETTETPATPAQQKTEQRSADGVISTPADVEAAAERLKGA
jgi:ClpP class serine protease